MVPQSQQLQCFSENIGGQTKIQYSSLEYSQLASLECNAWTLLYYLSITELNFWQFKLVKEQSLILCNSKFTAKKEDEIFTHHLLCQLLRW